VPILTRLTFLDLYTVEVEDVPFLEHILNCMPNLIQLTITFMLLNKTLINIIDVLDGQFWKELLSRHAPRLCKFDFFISVVYTGQLLVNLDGIDMLTISTLPFRRVTYLFISFENRMLTWLWNKLMKLG